MSTLEKLREDAERMAIESSYEGSCKNGIGELKITNLNIPNISGFSPLDKIWSSVRKRIWEQHGVQTTAIFFLPEEGEISGQFLPNLAVATSEEEERQYIKKFQESFAEQMELFAGALYNFLCDYELGYVSYVSYIQNNVATPEECSAKLDAFLRAYEYKTKEDDREKKRRKMRRKEILDEIDSRREI